MPAGAEMPAPIEYIKIVEANKLRVEVEIRTVGAPILVGTSV